MVGEWLHNRGIYMSWEKGKMLKIIVKRFKYECSSVKDCEFKKGRFCAKHDFCEYRVIA